MGMAAAAAFHGLKCWGRGFRARGCRRLGVAAVVFLERCSGLIGWEEVCYATVLSMVDRTYGLLVSKK